MSIKKRILKSPLAQAALAFVLAQFIRLVYYSSRITRHIDPASMRYMRGEDNAIFAFWHGRMMMLSAFNPPRRHMRVLISLHRDGLLISKTIGHFNQSTVSGSTSRGGKAAVMEMLRALEAGDNISITPDGPRGPRHVLAPGIITVAKHSGKPILPVTFASTRAKTMRSWDQFHLALPFGRIAFCVGAPIVVEASLDETGEEAARLRVEQAMNILVEQAQAAIRD